MRTAVLFEDSAAPSAWLQDCVASMPELSVSHRADNLSDAAALMHDWLDHPPTLVLLDLQLGRHSALNLLRRLRIDWPGTPVLVLSPSDQETHFIEAMQAGASGYLVRDGDSNALACAIDAVLSGLIPMGAPVARHLMAWAAKPGRRVGPATAHRASSRLADSRAGAPADPLTRSQHAVLACLARGLTYDMTSVELNVSRSTVQTHVRALYRKLGANCKVGAISRAKALRLIPER